MKLAWKSYGDTGRTAVGDEGCWRIITCGKWWHLTLDNSNRGKFFDRTRAMEFAQEREDGVEILPGVLPTGEQQP